MLTKSIIACLSVIFPLASLASANDEIMPMSDPDADPCGRIEELGPIGSLVRECLENRYQIAERELTEAGAEFLQSLGTPPDNGDSADDPVEKAAAARRQHVEDSQAKWEEYRHSACEEVYYEFWPGSMAANARFECLLKLTTARTAYLRERLLSQNDD